MKEALWNRTTKSWLLGLVFGLVLGSFYGANAEANRTYKDCRFAGVIRIGEAAFKCEQFSKVVLLTPDEVVKKQEKK